MKIILKDTGQQISIKSTRKPKFRGKGRTWDCVAVIKIEDKKRELYADTTWGTNFYFEYNGVWYKGDVWDVDILNYLGIECEVKRGKVKNGKV